MQPRLEKVFARLEAGDTPQKNIGTVQQQAKPVIYLIDKPGAIQSTIFAGHIAPPTANPDEITIETMNNILGGNFGARINMNLREDKHWSYGAQSLFFARAASVRSWRSRRCRQTRLKSPLPRWTRSFAEFSATGRQPPRAFQGSG